MWRPFKPSSFADNTEAMRGLYKQGAPLAFYKGNGVRSLHILLFHKLNAELTFKIEQNFRAEWKQIKQIPLAGEMILSCTTDFLL